MLFDGGELFVRHALDRVYFGAFDEGARLFRQKLHALRRAVRALIVLPREIADRKYLIFLADPDSFQVYVIDGRLGKHRRNRRLQFRLGQPLHVVT